MFLILCTRIPIFARNYISVTLIYFVILAIKTAKTVAIISKIRNIPHYEKNPLFVFFLPVNFGCAIATSGELNSS